MNILRLTALALLATVLAACNPGSHISIDGDQPLKHLTIKEDRVGLRSSAGDMAWIEADGSLEIGGESVALDASQRALTSRFYTEANAIRDDGIAIGKSGASMAGKSLRSVVTGLAGGDPDAIGPEIEAEARKLETSALQLCGRVVALQSLQDQLAQGLPAFAPFAPSDSTRTGDCTRQTTQAAATVGSDSPAVPAQD